MATNQFEMICVYYLIMLYIYDCIEPDCVMFVKPV